MTILLGHLILVLISVQEGAPGASPRAAAAQCLPRDDAAQQPEFFAFRAQLQMAVARRDVAAVLQVADPGIRTSFGPDGGRAALKRDLENRNGRAWQELAGVLALGGAFRSPETFVAPYTDGCGEAGRDVTVIGSNVNVRAAASNSAPVLTTISFAIIQAAGTDANGWTAVTLPDGRRGFIAARYIRSPFSYRAYFTKVRGAWRMTAFVAGD